MGTGMDRVLGIRLGMGMGTGMSMDMGMAMMAVSMGMGMGMMANSSMGAGGDESVARVGLDDNTFLEFMHTKVYGLQRQCKNQRIRLPKFEEEDKEFPDPATHASLTVLKAGKGRFRSRGSVLKELPYYLPAFSRAGSPG